MTLCSPVDGWVPAFERNRSWNSLLHCQCSSFPWHSSSHSPDCALPHPRRPQSVIFTAVRTSNFFCCTRNQKLEVSGCIHCQWLYCYKRWLGESYAYVYINFSWRVLSKINPWRCNNMWEECEGGLHCWEVGEGSDYKIFNCHRQQTVQFTITVLISLLRNIAISIILYCFSLIFIFSL